MNTKALRQKILDLAIHGKLVPQDPNDEPASVLLERIKAEKERLIKEGKIKRTKRSKAACDKPHYPYELPEGWCFCCINDIAESLLGKTLDKSKDKGVPKEYLCAINVQWGRFDFSILKSFLIGENEFQRYSVKQGDLMVCEGGDVGRCAIWEENEREMYYQNALHRIRCEYGISNYFLQYALWYYKLNGTIDYLCKGVTIKHFTQTTMSKLAIPLPPSNEQKRIVDEIQRLFSIIDKVEERKDKLQLTIRQTKSKILDLAIHGKLVPQAPTDEPATELLKRINPKAEITCDNPQYGKLPNGWCETLLGNIGTWQSGATPSRLRKEYYGGSIPWLKTGDLNDGIVQSIPECITERALEETSVKLNPAGSILIAMYGATIGRIGILSKPATTNQACCACVDYLPEKKFLFYFLLANRENFIAMGGGGAQPNISKEKIIHTHIPLPPQQEQHRIVAKIEELFTQLDKIEASL